MFGEAAWGGNFETIGLKTVDMEANRIADFSLHVRYRSTRCDAARQIRHISGEIAFRPLYYDRV
jgi:hypothetical protein